MNVTKEVVWDPVLFCGVGHQTVYYCEQCEMNIIDEVLNTLSYICQTRGEILKF